MARRPPAREGLVEEIGGIRIARRRMPGWLLFVIVGVVAWGLYYLLTFSVTDVGTFRPPEGIVTTWVGALLR